MKNYKVAMMMFFVCLAFSGMAQKGIKLNLKVGDKLSQEIKAIGNRQEEKPEGGTAEVNSENVLNITYEILGADNGTYDIKATFSAIKYKTISVGDEGEITFDSQKTEDMAGDDGVLAKRVIGKSFVLTMDANTCKVIAIKERPTEEKPLERQLGPLDLPIYLFPQDDDQLKRKVEGVFGGRLPDEKLVAGFKWDKTDTKKKDGITTTTNASYIIDRIEGGKIYVNITDRTIIDGVPEGSEDMGEFKVTGNSNGNGSVSFDAATGLKIESKSTVKNNQCFKSPNGEQKTIVTASYTETIKKVSK